MDETSAETSHKQLPFNNLYLISGLVHGQNKSWMYFITLTFLITGYVLFQSLILFPLMNILLQNGYSETEILKNANLLFDSQALKMDKNIVLMLELGMFVFAFIGFFLGLKFIHRKDLTSVLTGYEKFRFGRFFFAFTVWGILLVGTVLIDYFFNSSDMKIVFNPLGLAISVLVMLLLMPIQTGLEEIIFRGYLVQGLSQVFKNGYIPLFIASMLFASAHMSNPEVDEYGWQIMFTYYCSFALFMGALTLLDEGLELAFGIHFANNFISSILVSSSHSVIKTYSIFETKTENPYGEIVSWFLMAALTFGICLYKYCWRNFKLIIK